MEQQGRLGLPGDSGKHRKGGIPDELKRSGMFSGMNVTIQGDTDMRAHTVGSFVGSL